MNWFDRRAAAPETDAVPLSNAPLVQVLPGTKLKLVEVADLVVDGYLPAPAPGVSA